MTGHQFNHNKTIRPQTQGVVVYGSDTKGQTGPAAGITGRHINEKVGGVNEEATRVGCWTLAKEANNRPQKIIKKRR
ncbi:hypothetical protein OUZ56_014569 [Daphnia magna]|uniref:Uncharacterized protein n=1 Tax=Daphnia magna TaxID=35525 RepID=A0ABR0AK73_9CRUS|nr:hypothetical protein OUZ56_014569 [Daphnia magna]